MKDLYLAEITDKYIRENFLRISNEIKDLEDEVSLNQAPTYKTSVRDTLNPKKGQIIYNDTTGKFQGYNGSAWVDFN
jgi:hypothetical protein